MISREKLLEIIDVIYKTANSYTDPDKQYIHYTHFMADMDQYFSIEFEIWEEDGKLIDRGKEE